MKKFTALLLALVFTVVMLTSCSVSFESYTYETMDFEEGISVLLPDDMEKVENSKHTIAMKNDFMMFLALKEMKNDLNIHSLDAYVDAIVEINEMNPDEIKNLDGTPYYTFVSEDTDEFYFVAMMESEDAYWLLHFVCRTSDTEDLTPKFEEFTKSITFA